MNHYTDINALPKILVKNPKYEREICLWGTHIDYLNDKNEGKIGKQVIQKLNENNPEIQLNDLLDDIYVISFSEIEDSLPMWNMYGGNGSGVMLKFDFYNSNFTNYNMTKCTYKDIDEVIRVDQSFTNLLKRPAIRIGSLGHDGILPDNEQIKIRQMAIPGYSMAYRVAPKDKSFIYEEERRMFTTSNARNVKYRVRNNLLIPYIEEYFPQRILKEIWIGPTNDMERSTKSINMLLKTRGFKDVVIKQSNVPYRS